MPTPTIAVTCAASDQGGESVAGGIYTAKLDQTEIYDGFVVPEQVTATADADGLAILNLWPNALGVNGSSYRITARNPDTGKKFFDASVVVPNNPCNLYQIIQNAPFPNVDSAQQALIDVQALVTIANQDVAATNADAQQTTADRLQTGEDRTAARDSATNALTSENEAGDKAAEASGHANAASGQAVLAANAAATTQTLRDSIITTQGSIGYLPPVAYAAGLAITLPAQTVSYSGQAYAPLLSALPFTTSGMFETAKFRLIQGVAGVDLAAVGVLSFDGSKNYVAGTLGARLGGEINIKDFPWLCKCDGVTDDTAGFHAALLRAKTLRGTLFHPGGVCRITSGYDATLAQGSVMIRGNGMNREGFLPNAGSVFQLDSTDPASFFYKLTANHHLQSKDITYACKQYVLDRQFFIFSAGLHFETFNNVNFESVEKPFVFKAGYFQNSSFTNVQFRNSGTFHSESSALLGTLLTLNNVNHEGAVPVNTEKQVCNLQGIRRICADNFLLEGALPSAGWTILKLNNAYEGYYTRAPFADFRVFHSEWSGTNKPLYTVDQVGGTVKFSNMIGPTSTGKYRLSSLAHVLIEDTSFSGTAEDPSLFFELEDDQCLVDFSNCAARAPDFTKAGFTHRATQVASITNGLGQVQVSNDGCQEIYTWGGGYPVAEGAVIAGAVPSISTDATYGRKLVYTAVAGAINAAIRAPTAGCLGIGDCIAVQFTVRLPNYTAGVFALRLESDGIYTQSAVFPASAAGTVVSATLVWMLRTVPANVGLAINTSTAVDLTGMLEVLQLSIMQGQTFVRRRVPTYPKNILTKAAAAPTAGAWLQGDRVINSAPAVGSPKAWTCTVTGAPGTWVSEGNL